MTAYNAAPIRFFGVSQTTATLGANDPQLGDRCSEAGIDYVFVYNNTTTQISQQLGCVASAVAGYSVTVSSLVDADVCIGVARNATIPTNQYGWVATRGFVTVNFGAAISAAAGAFLEIGTDGSFAPRPASNATGLLFGEVCGKVMSAVASGGSTGVYLNCH